MQKEIEINNIKVPIIEEGGCRWYPISYIGKKVLLKDLSPSQLKLGGRLKAGVFSGQNVDHFTSLFLI
jgi:hypothetical protein